MTERGKQSARGYGLGAIEGVAFDGVQIRAEVGAAGGLTVGADLQEIAGTGAVVLGVEGLRADGVELAGPAVGVMACAPYE